MRRALPLLLSSALLAGCLSGRNKGPVRGSAPSEAVLQSALADTVNPRQLGLTIYRSPEGPVFTDTNRTHPAQDDMLEFADKKSPLPVAVWETKERLKVPVLFDTRAPRSWVEFLTARSLGFRPAGPTPFSVRATHLNDTVEGYMALLPSLSFGALRFESVLWHVRPQYKTLGPVGRGLTRPEPLVVFGNDMMRALAYVRFDFFTRTVSYATDLPYRANKLHLVADLPFKLSPHGLTVEAMLDGKPGPLVIDTGGDFDLAMPLTADAPPVVRRIILGDFVRVNVSVNDAEFLGLLPSAPPSAGVRLFEGLILTLDFNNGRFLLETPAPATPEP